MKLSEYEKLKKGDTFVGKIQSKKYKKYNNYLLVLNIVDKYLSGDFYYIVITTYLVKNKKNNLENIEKKDCICTKIVPLEEKFLPLDFSVPLKEHIKNIEKIEVYPDKDGRLFEYNYILKLEKGNTETFSKELEYIGNYLLPVPKNNYRPISDYNILFIFIDIEPFSKFVDKMLDYYEKNNLQKGIFFSKTEFEKIRTNCINDLHIQLSLEKFLRKMEGQDESLSALIELKPNPNTEIDEETGDTLTYVGSPPVNKEDIDSK